MPTKPNKPCLHPGCGKLTQSRYCSIHDLKQKDQAKKYDRQRGTAAQRGYDKPWRQLRESVILRDMFTCQKCGKIVTRKGEAHVDHIISKERGGGDELSNLQTLCCSCHSIKTIREDNGYGGNASAKYHR